MFSAFKAYGNIFIQSRASNTKVNSRFLTNTWISLDFMIELVSSKNAENVGSIPATLRILGECLLISSWPGKALRMLVDIARLEPDFYGDMVYKLKKIVGSGKFSVQLEAWIFYVFVLSCVCYVFVRVCLYVLFCYLLGKGWPLGSRLWCLTVSLSLSHWYPGSGVELDCIDRDLCTLTYFART